MLCEDYDGLFLIWSVILRSLVFFIWGCRHKGINKDVRHMLYV